MGIKQQVVPHAEVSATDALAPLGAQRLLVMGGIVLIIVGMIFGDIFAVFVLHPNADRIGQRLLTASNAVAARDRAGVLQNFADIGKLLENRGTKVDAHVHIIDFGYIAFVLALIQPYVALSEKRKRQLAILLLTGAILLPIGVFLIYYLGPAYSPFQFLGWASVAADFGGFLLIVACIGELLGIWKYFRRESKSMTPVNPLLSDRSLASRLLLSGGTLLILAGFLFGAYYAGFDLYRHEAQEISILNALVDSAAAGQSSAVANSINDYGALQANKAVKIAAHAHFIEFGVIAFLLGFVQPYVFLSERWKNRWVVVLLIGSVTLPLFVPLELQWGLPAGGIADMGGALVVVAMLAMLVGMLRFTGRQDAKAGLL